MNHLDHLAMPSRCGDCAFTAGTDAHTCEATRLTAALCVQSGEPFFCHQPNAAGSLEPRILRGQPMFCRGFVEAFIAAGPTDDWRAAVASECLRILEDATSSLITPEAATDRIVAAVSAERQ